jgi:hypothetical protein
MLSNFSQYSPQGFIPQFPGLQGAGWPQMSPGLFGQPGAYAGFVPFAHEPALAGMYQNPFAPSPVAYNPLLGSFAAYAGVHHPAQQIVLVLGQLAQQISVQTALTQQISIALQQLVQQLAVQGLQIPGAGVGAFQGAYGGFAPQAQAWGANRAQTIQ